MGDLDTAVALEELTACVTDLERVAADVELLDAIEADGALRADVRLRLAGDAESICQDGDHETTPEPAPAAGDGGAASALEEAPSDPPMTPSVPTDDDQDEPDGDVDEDTNPYDTRPDEEAEDPPDTWCGVCGAGPFSGTRGVKVHHGRTGHDGEPEIAMAPPVGKTAPDPASPAVAGDGEPAIRAAPDEPVETPPIDADGAADHDVGDELPEDLEDDGDTDGDTDDVEVSPELLEALPAEATVGDVEAVVDDVRYLHEVADAFDLSTGRARALLHHLDLYSDVIEGRDRTGGSVDGD